MAVSEQRDAASTAPRFRAPVERCPFAPAAVAPVAPTAFLVPQIAAAIYGDVVSHPASFAQAEAQRRIARDRANGKRGPPSLQV